MDARALPAASSRTTANALAATLTAEPPRFVCAEVWGGNRPIDVPLRLPGIRGRVYSQPCAGGRGGDIHYVSICSSGLVSRLCIADVAGHGEPVARVSGEIHQMLRRFMNHHDERQVLAALNRRLVESELTVLTTAATLSYLPMLRRVSISYAGHPPAWLYSGKAAAWQRVLPEGARKSRTTTRRGSAAPAGEFTESAPPGLPSRPLPKRPVLMDLPLAVDEGTQFSRRNLRVRTGDRLLLVTDGVLEAPGAGGALYGEARLEAVLAAVGPADADTLVTAVLNDVRRHAGCEALAHDDVTILAVGFVPGPRIGVWSVLKNRLLRKLTPDARRAAPAQG